MAEKQHNLPKPEESLSHERPAVVNAGPAATSATNMGHVANSHTSSFLTKIETALSSRVQKTDRTRAAEAFPART